MFGKPSKKKFALQLIALFQEAGHSLKYDEDDFRLISEGEQGFVFNLCNVYEEHCNLPKAERAEHLQNLLNCLPSADSLPESFEEASGSLRPKIWTRQTIDLMQLRARCENSERPDLPLYPLGAHHYSSLVFDTPTAMRSLSKSDLEGWGVQYYPALEAACHNLDEHTTMWSQIGDHFYASMSGDSYDSSRVLLLDKIKAFDVLGTHVACVPNRESMFVCGSEDEESLNIMFELAEKTLAEDPRPGCPLPLIIDGDEWADWVPPRNHSIRPRYDQLALQYFGNAYHNQKELLEQLFEWDVDNAAFVASFMAFEKDGVATSVASWGEGVDSLLPRTDQIAFSRGRGDTTLVDWGTAAEIVGNLLVEDPSYYPIRYRVREFPSDSQFDELAAVGD